MLKDYYVLAKPGLVYGNIIPVIAGFVLATSVVLVSINFWLLLAVVIGISLVMASGCVFNNVIDRDIDSAMARTKQRALVSGKISTRAALIYGAILGAIGFAILSAFTNWLTFGVAALGFFVYVFFYSMWAKRGSEYGAIVGSVAGAVPPVVGYCAVSGRLDAAAIIIFAILVLWQMPHFYAISIWRFDDYAAAGVPVLPVKKGIQQTKITMILYIVAFGVAASFLTAFGYVGAVYLVIALLSSAAWLVLCIKGFFNPDFDADKRWARKMFFLSLVVMVGLFVAITAGAIL